MRSFLLPAAAGSVLSLILSGCGGSDPASSTAAPAPTPLCVDIPWRLVTPSQAGNTSENATNRFVPHFVTSNPTTADTDLLRVFLPGTYGQPGGSTYLLRSIADCSRPTIGLSYNFIPFPDATRNEICLNATEGDETARVECLALQHSDSISGSTPGSLSEGLWPPVAAMDSVVGRLFNLLMFLNKKFPEEEWRRFIDDAGTPRWSKIMMSGHSQGAGHTAYMAQTMKLAAAVLLSGPQDECIDCGDGSVEKLWLAQPWNTSHVTAAAHASESASDVVQFNWDFMKSNLSWPEKPFDMGTTALTPPPYGAALTDAPYDPSYTGPRPYHVSMAGDGVTPMTLGQTTPPIEVALYGQALWPALFKDPPTQSVTLSV